MGTDTKDYTEITQDKASQAMESEDGTLIDPTSLLNQVVKPESGRVSPHVDGQEQRTLLAIHDLVHSLRDGKTDTLKVIPIEEASRELKTGNGVTHVQAGWSSTIVSPQSTVTLVQEAEELSKGGNAVVEKIVNARIDVIHVLAGDQRLNSIHNVPLIQKIIAEKIKKKFGIDNIEIQVFAHNDTFGKANGEHKAAFYVDSAGRKIDENEQPPFKIVPNNIENPSWTAAYQFDALFRDDTNRQEALLYALTDEGVDELVKTEYSWGLVPHPKLLSLSTDRLGLKSFPEIYHCPEEPTEKKGLGKQLLDTYLRNILRTSGEKREEILARIKQVMQWKKEYEETAVENTTHDGLMNYVVGKVVGEPAAHYLGSTFEQYRLDRIDEKSHLHTLLELWLTDYENQREQYNQAMRINGNEEKEQLKEGELPYWVAFPMEYGEKGKLYHRYALYRNNESFALKTEKTTVAYEKEEDDRDKPVFTSSTEEIQLEKNLGRPVKTPQDMAELITINMPDISPSDIAIIPRSHILLCQLSLHDNVIIQPLKPAAYSAEANAYAESIGISNQINTLFLRTDVWRLLAENKINPPSELASLIGEKTVTGKQMQRLESEILDMDVQNYLASVAHLQVLMYRKSLFDLKNNPKPSFPKPFAHVVCERLSLADRNSEVSESKQTNSFEITNDDVYNRINEYLKDKLFHRVKSQHDCPIDDPKLQVVNYILSSIKTLSAKDCPPCFIQAIEPIVLEINRELSHIEAQSKQHLEANRPIVGQINKALEEKTLRLKQAEGKLTRLIQELDQMKHVKVLDENGVEQEISLRKTPEYEAKKEEKGNAETELKTISSELNRLKDQYAQLNIPPYLKEKGIKLNQAYKLVADFIHLALAADLIASLGETVNQQEYPYLSGYVDRLKAEYDLLINQFDENDRQIRADLETNTQRIQQIRSEISQASAEIGQDKNRKAKLCEFIKEQTKKKEDCQAQIAKRDDLEKKITETILLIKNLKAEQAQLENPESLKNREQLIEKSGEFAQQILHNLIKGSNQLKYASYYLDPVQLYIGWGPESVERLPNHIELSEVPYIVK